MSRGSQSVAAGVFAIAILVLGIFAIEEEFNTQALMTAATHVLAIDQGTTSTRAILFNRDAQPVATDQREFPQHYPEVGWVEHDVEDIWRDTVAVSRGTIAQSGVDAGQTAMVADGANPPAALRIDGGMAANDWLCQFLADVAECPVERPAGVETTALGAAFLAGLATGVWPNLAGLAATWTLGRQFEPTMTADHRSELILGWQKALKQALG